MADNNCDENPYQWFYDHEPKTFEEAVDLMWDFMGEDGRNSLVGPDSSMHHHFGIGIMMRNGWMHRRPGTPDTPLVAHFKDRWGIGHADDISGVITEALTAKRLGKDYNPEDTVKRYKDHWAKSGVDALTGREIARRPGTSDRSLWRSIVDWFLRR